MFISRIIPGRSRGGAVVAEGPELTESGKEQCTLESYEFDRRPVRVFYVGYAASLVALRDGKTDA
jgi:hypothetical protein